MFRLSILMLLDCPEFAFLSAESSVPFNFRSVEIDHAIPQKNHTDNFTDICHTQPLLFSSNLPSSSG